MLCKLVKGFIRLEIGVTTLDGFTKWIIDILKLYLFLAES